MVVQHILPEAVVKRLYLFHLSTLLIVCSFHFSHFSGRVVVWHSSFWQWSTFLYMGYLDISSWDVPKSLPICLLGFYFFHNDLCIYFILDAICLLDIGIVNAFSQSVACLFNALIFFFWWTQILNFNRAQFISISLLLLMLFAYLQIRELFSSKD